MHKNCFGAEIDRPVVRQANVACRYCGNPVTHLVGKMVQCRKCNAWATAASYGDIGVPRGDAETHPAVRTGGR